MQFDLKKRNRGSNGRATYFLRFVKSDRGVRIYLNVQAQEYLGNPTNIAVGFDEMNVYVLPDETQYKLVTPKQSAGIKYITINRENPYTPEGSKAIPVDVAKFITAKNSQGEIVKTLAIPLAYITGVKPRLVLNTIDSA